METEVNEVKQVIANETGVGLEEVSDSMVDAYRDTLVGHGEPDPTANLDQKPDVDETESIEDIEKVKVETDTQKTGNEETETKTETVESEEQGAEAKVPEEKDKTIPKLPDKLKDHFISKKELDGYVKLEDLAKGDPIVDKNHPLYGKIGNIEKIVKDNQKTARDSMLRVSELDKQLADMESLKADNDRFKKLLFDGEGDPVLNDPVKGIYKGMTLEDARDEDKESEWLDARDDYRESLRKHESDNRLKSQEDKEFTENFEKEKSNAQKDLGIDDETFTKYDREFATNGIPLKTAFAGQVIFDKFGGLDGIIPKSEHETIVKSEVEKAKKELMDNLRNRRMGINDDIPSSDGRTIVPGKGKENNVISEYKRNPQSVLNDPKKSDEFIRISTKEIAEGNNNFLNDYD